MRASYHSKQIASSATYIPFGSSPDHKKTSDFKINIIDPKATKNIQTPNIQNSQIMLQVHDPEFNFANYGSKNHPQDIQESIISLIDICNAIDSNTKSNYDQSQLVYKQLPIKQQLNSSHAGLSSKTNKTSKIEQEDNILNLNAVTNLSSPPSLLIKTSSFHQQKSQIIQNSKLNMQVSFNSVNQEHPIITQKIDIPTLNEPVAQPSFPKKQIQNSPTQLIDKGRLCESFISENKTEQKKSKSKLKLRDYLYITQATSKRASLQKHELIQKRKSPSSSGMTEVGSPTRSMISKQSSSPHSSIISRQTVIPKYQISNSQMFNILKKQMCNDLNSIKDKLKKIEEQLQDTQSCDKEPTNEQLLILYNMRREIKEQLQKRTVSCLQSLTKSKKNNLLKSRARIDSQQQKYPLRRDQFRKNNHKI